MCVYQWREGRREEEEGGGSINHWFRTSAKSGLNQESINDKKVNILDFASHTVAVAALQLCHYSTNQS